MRLSSVRTFVVSSSMLLMLSFAACSESSSSSPGLDGGGADGPVTPNNDGGTPKDDATADAAADVEEPLTKSTEAEPNNGNPETQTNPMPLPGAMTGAIDPANDIDIFTVQLAPGDLWEWTMAPTAGALSPHLTIFDTTPNNLNPVVLTKASPGATASLQHFVLRPGSFVAAVRDARNVPTPAGQGGPTFGYTLTGRKKTPTPVAITFPTTKSGKLASLSSVDLYSFTGTKGTGFDIVIKAARKASPSTMDSRLSLFDLTAKTAIITNDDAAGSSDSQIGGDLPTSATYLVIVENEGTNAADLSYEIEFTLR